MDIMQTYNCITAYPSDGLLKCGNHSRGDGGRVKRT